VVTVSGAARGIGEEIPQVQVARLGSTGGGATITTDHMTVDPNDPVGGRGADVTTPMSTDSNDPVGGRGADVTHPLIIDPNDPVGGRA
jgi:hypothetical protein